MVAIQNLSWCKCIGNIYNMVRERDIKQIYRNHLKHIVPMHPLSAEQQKKHDDSRICFICGTEFKQDCVKVLEHCHVTGRYRGCAHSTCNLNYKVPSYIPVFFHNLSGYDSHLFIKQLANETEQIDVLPLSTEKYITFGKHLLVDEINKCGKIEKKFIHLRFVDSFKFLSSSLDSLSKNLSDDQCLEVRKFFSNDEEFKLVRMKGCFPYSYVDSFDKLEETDIPPLEKFYDEMRGENISPDDYQRAVTVYQTFNCKSLGEYSDVYLKSDVLLLSDVFENFRKLCMKIYGLDPAHYLTAPGLTWDAMLKYTKVKLELLTDMNMYHFFKKGIRGGVSTCIKRKSIANNEFVPDYDPSQPKTFIQYLDVTNLYGKSMTEYLPHSGFRWLNEIEIQNFNVFDIGDEDDLGYVLEVDLHYPQHLHCCHNDLPFCPENITPPNSTQSKLIPNFCDKNEYIIHYRNLKQCLDHGLIVNRVHRILEFRQSPWLKQYINLNTKMRNNAKNKFEVGFYKQMNNGVFGKTMENVDKRKTIKLLTHWENFGRHLGIESYVAKPNFKSFVQFSQKLYAVLMNRVSVLYNKPVYVGFTILDISKIVIYRFFYDVLRRHYGNNVSLLYTDTDSLIVEIKTDDLYQHIRDNLHEYDTSNFKDNLHGVPTTVSMIGKMKDEYAGKVIKCFYGAGSKAYCVKLANDEMVKKAKGVKKSVIKNVLTECDYQSVSEQSNKTIMCKMISFRSTLHDIYTILINKISLSSKDDKRFVIPNTCETYAWGHYKIPCENNDPLDELLRIAHEVLLDTPATTDQLVNDVSEIDEIVNDAFDTIMNT
ncbi:hypothetical protein RI129_005522 [Pyrocoelia pectoralis]|uniref:DNA-directed DNA polymerase n=1 Tax=Pyrocoelia pectoralis TaxID=417401 RepID=A0AAN7VL78_9COLE